MADADSQSRVVLVPERHAHWARRFAALSARIGLLLPDAAIEHIGSTAIPDFPSKDVVDVLVGVSEARLDESVKSLRQDGFDMEGRRSGHAWLSVPSREQRTAVVHVVTRGGQHWCDRIEFRDLLRRSPQARARYLRVKTYAADDSLGWGEYTARKATVVHAMLSEHRASQVGILGG